MSKKVKQMELAALKKTFGGVRDMVVLSPSKIDSATEYSMRKTLRDKKVRLQMVKNTLARKVLRENGVELGAEVWNGPTLIAWGADSLKDLSKAVDALLKDLKKDPKAPERLKVKTAVAEGTPVSLEDAIKMPTRLEIIGELVGMLLGPANRIAGALVGPANQVAGAIAAIADKKKDEPAAG